jgi:hypothetical protein
MNRDPRIWAFLPAGRTRPRRGGVERCRARTVCGMVAAGLLFAVPARADSDASAASPPQRSEVSRPSRHPWLRGDPGAARSVGGEAWWPGIAGITLLLAVCGGIAVVARRFGPRPAAGAVHVVGRVGLSPRHSVYLLRVGRKVLLVGTGPQGPPALITELDDVPSSPPCPPREDDE